mgnify:CR=1 FL=1
MIHHTYINIVPQLREELVELCNEAFFLWEQKKWYHTWSIHQRKTFSLYTQFKIENTNSKIYTTKFADILFTYIKQWSSLHETTHSRYSQLDGIVKYYITLHGWSHWTTIDIDLLTTPLTTVINNVSIIMQKRNCFIFRVLGSPDFPHPVQFYHLKNMPWTLFDRSFVSRVVLWVDEYKNKTSITITEIHLDSLLWVHSMYCIYTTYPFSLIGIKHCVYEATIGSIWWYYWLLLLSIYSSCVVKL